MVRNPVEIVKVQIINVQDCGSLIYGFLHFIYLIPGILNTDADEESRKKISELKLNFNVFQNLVDHFHLYPETDFIFLELTLFRVGIKLF